MKNAVGEGASIVSNFQGGSGPAWHLLDLSRAVRLFIYQERLPFDLQRRDRRRAWPRRRPAPDRGDRGWDASYSGRTRLAGAPFPRACGKLRPDRAKTWHERSRRPTHVQADCLKRFKLNFETPATECSQPPPGRPKLPKCHRSGQSPLRRGK